jgi:hypothetical protein
MDDDAPQVDLEDRRVRADPLVGDPVRRELPARLVVEVKERVPAAYWAADSTLWPLDAEGRALPLDPTHFGWDLPVLLAPVGPGGAAPALQAGRLVDGDSLALLRLVIGIRDGVPEIARRISTARLGSDGRVALRLVGEGGEVRLRLETPIRKVALLPDVLRDLEIKRQAFETVDLSFEDQIVVRPAGRADFPAPLERGPGSVAGPTTTAGGPAGAPPGEAPDPANGAGEPGPARRGEGPDPATTAGGPAAAPPGEAPAGPPPPDPGARGAGPALREAAREAGRAAAAAA